MWARSRPADARTDRSPDAALARLEPCSVRVRELRTERLAASRTGAGRIRAASRSIAAVTGHSILPARTVGLPVATAAFRDRNLNAVVSPPPLRTAAGSVPSHRLRAVRCRVAGQAAGDTGTGQHRVPPRSAAIRMATAADRRGPNSICTSPSCAVRPMAEADTLEADTARQAMVDLAACRVIRGRAMAAVRGRAPVTVEVAMRPAAEDTSGAEVAVVTRAAVEVTPAVEAEVIRAVADMAADTTRLQSAS
jgi:hypothetical protein